MSQPHESFKVRKRAKIRNRYNQAPHLTQDTNGKVTTSQIHITNGTNRSALSHQVTTRHQQTDVHESKRKQELTGPKRRSLWLTRDQLGLQKCALYYSWSNCDYRSDCYVVSAKLRPRPCTTVMIQHGPGHLGQDKTLH